MKQFLKNSIPDSIKAAVKAWLSTKPKSGWFGNYASWEEAKRKCTGYDNDEILKKVKASILKVKNGEAAFERDSVLFDKLDYSEPLVAIFKKIAAEKGNRLHVVDFGGSLGSSYFQNRNVLKELNRLDWSVVEQAHFVDCGIKFIQDDQLKFYYSIGEALANNKADVLFLSSVVQYFEKPYELIKECLTYDFDYIVVDRTAFVETTQERITVQIVPESIYKASYPAWFFNEQKFVASFMEKYELLSEFDSKFDPKEPLDDKVMSYRKGFLFKRKN